MDDRPAANSTSRSCPHCGAEIGEYASFCWECQRSVTGPAPAVAPAAPATVSAPYAPAPAAPPPAPAATWYPSPLAPPPPAPVEPPTRRFRLGSTIAALAVIGIAILGGILVSEAIRDDGSDGSGTAPINDERPGSEDLGRWLVQIQTFNSGIDADRVQASVDALAAEGLESEVLLSDDFASLEPGSWVFYESSWPTVEEAVARCVELGRTERNCFARLLTDDPADRDQVQFPGD